MQVEMWNVGSSLRGPRFVKRWTVGAAKTRLAGQNNRWA